MPWQAWIFIGLSIPIVILSRASLTRPRSHGFWRFLAWEAILALGLLHVDHWFANPFAWHQLISWFLLIVCCVPVVWGVINLRGRGRPAERREGDPTLVAFEKTTELVTTGIYRYIRHPLYSSLLLLTWGVFFKQPSWLGAGLSIASTVFLVLTALADEAECRSFFGTSYDAYMRRTKRFIPFVA
jgi:protein-S-isoprenylcysteine O-methyltransferase Ste14